MMQYNAIACTGLGYSHISANKICQDYSLAVETDDFQAVIVSDGHGSSNFVRSDRGSKFACEASEEALKEFMTLFPHDSFHLTSSGSVRDENQIVAQLCKNILLRWNQKIDRDVKEDPFTEEEVKDVAEKYRFRYLQGEAIDHAYGATLIIALVTENFFLAIRNGDGECVRIDSEGTLDTPIPWNENCEFNVTTSLCDQEAINDFRYYYSETLPAAVFIGSDGVDDSYSSQSDLFHLYRRLSLTGLDHGAEELRQYIEDFLPELTRRGSGDDVSIACLLDPVALQGARASMESVLEERKKQYEEEEQKRQERIQLANVRRAEANLEKLARQMKQLETDQLENKKKIGLLPGFKQLCAVNAEIVHQKEELEKEIAEAQLQLQQMQSFDSDTPADKESPRAPEAGEPSAAEPEESQSTALTDGGPEDQQDTF